MLTRRKFFRAVAVAAVAMPAMVLLPAAERKPDLNAMWRDIAEMFYGPKTDVELWAGGVTWVDGPVQTIHRMTTAEFTIEIGDRKLWQE